MQQWEYKSIKLSPLQTLLLDQYGSDGWELVSLVAELWHPVMPDSGYDIPPSGGDVVVYRATFKRPKQ